MTARTLLFLGTRADEPYIQQLSFALAGTQHALKASYANPSTVAEVELAASRVPGLAGIITTNAHFVQRVLDQTPDFAGRKEKLPSMESYAGSLLWTARRGIPVLCIESLATLVTRKAWARVALRRYVRKLTNPTDWFAVPEFTYGKLHAQNLMETYNRWQREAILMAVDIETIVDDPYRRMSLVGYSALLRDGTVETKVLDLFDTSSFAGPDGRADALAAVALMNRTRTPKILQGGNYDNAYFARWGVPLVNYKFDTMNLFHCMFSEFPKRLDFIAAYALRDIRYWKDESGNEPVRYNAKDAFNTLMSFLALAAEAEPYAFQNYLIEFPLNFPCLHCELDGLKIDEEIFREVQTRVGVEIEEKTAEFQELIAAPNFNTNSPQQTKKLFALLGLDLPSTDAANMLKARASGPVQDFILSKLVAIRKLRKLASSYLVDEKIWNGRVHYRLDPPGTDTGRLASRASSFWTGMQIQNMPRGKEIKQFLMADDGSLLGEVDKAQSEARCVGYITGETALIELVEGPHDYHAWNAQSFFGVPYEEIYDEAAKKTKNSALRDLSKRTNHGANYNMGAGVMLATMGPTAVLKAKIILKLPAVWSLKKVCQYLLDKYAQTYPRVKTTYQQWLIREIGLKKRLTSALGWTRIFFGRVSMDNKPALNAAVAHAPQNLSVGIINREFKKIWYESVYGELRGKIRIKAQIHDSILFSYKKEFPEIPQLIAQKYMSTRIPVADIDGVERSMMIPVDVSAGKTHWGQLK